MKDIIKQLVSKAIRESYPGSNFEEFIEVQNVTAKNIDADYFTNISMKLAKKLKINPTTIAEKIIASLDKQEDFIYFFSKPGYINFKVTDIMKNNIIQKINESDNLLCGCKTDNPKKINVEFVSANPTGPLHVGHGRGAIYGNIIAKFLTIQGHNVTKEYYVNDFGNQIHILLISIFSKIDNEYAAGYNELYQGEYINHIASNLTEEQKKLIINNSKDFFKKIDSSGPEKNLKTHIVNLMVGIIQQSLMNLNIDFDNWFYESSLFENNNVSKIINKLEQDNYTFTKDGALMIQADEPRVIIKSDGNYTYFASDLAYHNIKMNDYDSVINIWGADHHGYVPRVKVGLKALGHDIDKLDVHLVQFANLFKNGEKISMSTRKGQYIELESLRKEIGNDAINFFYLTKNKDQHIDFDLNIAIQDSKNNPVYYIQYAFARIEKILISIEGYDINKHKFKTLDNDSEKEIIDTLNSFTEIFHKAIIQLEPHLITNYLYKLSQEFHSYYANVKILDNKINYDRVYLIKAIQKVIKCGLDLLNISSPKEM